MIIAPQNGPQTEFLKTPATICIYGGSAGSGKTYALLLEPLRHINNSKFSAITFRRNATQIRNQGGMWASSMELYSALGGRPREAFLEWKFPSGATFKFAHLENLNTVYSYQGAQIPLIMWDELTHFEEDQFWYMMSRLRSTSGVPGYMRATTNPHPDSFVRNLIDWYLDPEGYPIQERSGKIRWFIRKDDNLYWADSQQELIDLFGNEQFPTSFTFIAAKLEDNAILMAKDPNYLSNLHALSRVERMRLLGGNWNVRETAGMLFQRQWFDIIETVPADWISSIRFWDRACLIGNTKVLTEHGSKPIQNLTNRDKVLTRSGFCEVEWAGISKISNELTTVIFSNGKQITGTREHPIWTKNRGWVNLSNLTAEDTVYTEPKNIFIATKEERKGIGRYIEMFTNFIKGTYPKAIISTTKTATGLIIESKILSAFQEKSMHKSIKKICRLTLVLKILHTEKMHLNIFLKKSKIQKNIFAQVVELFFLPKVLRQNIAVCDALNLINIYVKFVNLFLIQEDLIQNIVVSPALIAGVPVFDISVKKTHEFFANGILVHNSTKPNESNKDPDWTRGLKLYRYPNGTFVVVDLKSTRDTPGQVENLIKAVASHDGRKTRIMSQQDPGSAGVAEALNFVKMLAGYDVRTVVISKDKITRAKPVSAQAEVGNIKILKAPWNEEFFNELENFPDGHDDIVDCLSGSYNQLSVGMSTMDVFHRMDTR